MLRRILLGTAIAFGLVVGLLMFVPIPVEEDYRETWVPTDELQGADGSYEVLEEDGWRVRVRKINRRGQARGALIGMNLAWIGDYVSYHENGLLREAGRYDFWGRRVGTWKGTSADGTVKWVREYEDGNVMSTATNNMVE